MTVYVVVCEVYREEACVVGVFDSEQKAEAARLYHAVEEHEVSDADNLEIYITEEEVK